jgi:5'-nucleotidase
MRILITNDDGILAPGLLALKAALAPLGEVLAVAPERPRSACGHAVTLHKPLRLSRLTLPDGTQGLACSGTPSDCVGLAVHGHAGPRPDLIVSGINLGPNVGWDLTYSGTVAAAMEAAINGVPTFAISLDTYEPADFVPAAEFARYLAAMLMRHGMPQDTFLNVNVPAIPAADIKGVAVTSQGRVVYEGELEERTDPRGRPYYWWTGGRSRDLGPAGTDLYAIGHDLISVTPIKLDLTDHGALSQLSTWGLQWPG